jgi:periplasmic divalent cation tolerance protein
MPGKIIIYTTFPGIKTARKIINSLLREKLIACGNIFKIDSHYRWKGKIERANEYAAFLKTRASLYKEVEAGIKKLHPYEVPEIVVLKIERGLPKYLKWVDDVTIN